MPVARSQTIQLLDTVGLSDYATIISNLSTSIYISNELREDKVAD